MSIRARIDRHSLWHPREDMEYEAATMDQICKLLSKRIVKEIKYALTNDEKMQGINPLAMRINESDEKPHRVKWENASSLYEIDVDVEITAVRRKEELKPAKRPKREEEE